MQLMVVVSKRLLSNKIEDKSVALLLCVEDLEVLVQALRLLNLRLNRTITISKWRIAGVNKSKMLGENESKSSKLSASESKKLDRHS